MPYQHCPACRLTVHIEDGEGGAPCPRCGETLRDEPRSLFARVPGATGSPARPAGPGRFARPTPPRISSAAVREALALRGGRRRSTA